VNYLIELVFLCQKMRKIEFEDIESQERRYRANFVNSLWGYRPLALIGTANAKGQTNLSIVNSLFHLGAYPPVAGLIFRPHSVERHSLENILSSRQYSVNLIPISLSQKAHQTSAKYPREESEFDAVGLTVIWHSDFLAPLVDESPVRIGMDLIRNIGLEENDTNLIIGRIRFVEIEDEMIGEDGFISHQKADICCGSGLDSYHRVDSGKRFTYARPGHSLRELNRDGDDRV
jgi:flavin reductase (DIM6/NTAB) family NADH-FMN oxidoreductase RutF